MGYKVDYPAENRARQRLANSSSHEPLMRLIQDAAQKLSNAVPKSSPTGTKTKTKKKQPSAKQLGAGGMKTFLHYGYSGKKSNKLQKAIDRAAKHVVYNFQESNRMVSTQGKQGATLMGQLLNSSAISTVASQVTIASNASTQRVFIKSARASYKINNMDPFNVTYKIYDCVPRNDLSNATYNDPVKTWAQGLTDEGATGTITIPGTTPFQTDSFTQNFRVIRTTKVILQPGMDHIHTVQTTPNRLFNLSRLEQATVAPRGMTCFSFVVQEGDVANDVTTKTSVTIGPSALDYITEFSYRFSGFSEETTTLVNQQILPTALTLEEINPATGAILADTTTQEA